MGLTKAQRLNRQMDKIFDRAHQFADERRAAMRDVTEEQALKNLLGLGYTPETARHHVTEERGKRAQA